MSYIDAVNRMGQIEQRLGILDNANWQRGSFETVLSTARSRLTSGPERIDTAGIPTSTGDSPDGFEAQARSARPLGSIGSTLPSSGASTTTGTGKVPADLAPIFAQAAAKTGVPEALIKAVARAESGFRVTAASPAGAEGIMQLMPGTARGLGVTNSMDPEQNILGGARYLKQMLTRFDGDVKLALAGYNAGPNAVARYGGVPPYKETQNYVVKVGGYAAQYGLTSMTVPLRR